MDVALYLFNKRGRRRERKKEREKEKERREKEKEREEIKMTKYKTSIYTPHMLIFIMTTQIHDPVSFFLNDLS